MSLTRLKVMVRQKQFQMNKEPLSYKYVDINTRFNSFKKLGHCFEINFLLLCAVPVSYVRANVMKGYTFLL